MSLWTPDGERPIRKEPAPEPAPATAPADQAPSGPPPGDGQPSLEDLSPEERARAEQMMAEMAEAQQRIAQTPAADVVANHVIGFYELAAIHLSQDPPRFDEATVAIDAMQAVLDALGERIGTHGAELSQALSQIQMAFVQIQEQASGTSS